MFVKKLRFSGKFMFYTLNADRRREVRATADHPPFFIIDVPFSLCGEGV